MTLLQKIGTVALGLAGLAYTACATPHVKPSPPHNQPDNRQCVEWKQEYDEGGYLNYRKCVAWEEDGPCQESSSGEFTKDLRIREQKEGSVRVGSTTVYDQSYDRKCEYK